MKVLQQPFDDALEIEEIQGWPGGARLAPEFLTPAPAQYDRQSARLVGQFLTWPRQVDRTNFEQADVIGVIEISPQHLEHSR